MKYAYLFFFFVFSESPKEDYLTNIVSAECMTCPAWEKTLVAEVVLNRVDSGIFPTSIEEVIKQKNQFHGYCKGWYVWHPDSERAVLEAKKKRKNKDILYFWKGDKPKHVKEVVIKGKEHNFGI